MEKGRKLLFMILLVISIIAIVIAALGFCFKCLKNRCFVCTYGLILIPTWLVYMIFGGIGIGLSTVSKDAVESACTDLSDQLDDLSNRLSSNIGDIQGGSDFAASVLGECGDSSIGEVKISVEIYDAIKIDNYMCSDVCPCKDVGNKNDWINSPNPKL